MATRLTLEFNEKDFLIFKKFRDLFPEFRAMALGYIGNIGKKVLKQQFLSGQELNLKAFPTDSKGRRTISYSVGKSAKHVRISSYPMNLFERGRKLRSGKKEAGKFVVTRKFKQLMMSNLQNIVNEFDSKYLQKEADKL